MKEENGSNVVYFKDAETIAAGVPYFLYLPENMRGQQWSVELTNNDGIVLATSVTNPETGILGSFNTINTGAWTDATPMYKIKNDGVTLVRTTASSNCYPFRGYLKLPGSNNAKDYVLSFDDYDEGTAGISSVNSVEQTDDYVYNLAGQRVSRSTKGIVIINGKKYHRK